MLFSELETIINKYILLADQGIIKLLAATVIANRIPQLDPTWLFIVSSSSGGKSELLLALSFANGIIQKDDLTSRTFVSGAKSGQGKPTSLLDRLPPNAIMVIKDLTVLLKKDVREADSIFSQLRMIYDGSFSKSFGTGEDIEIPVRMGLIAGVTSVIEDFQADDAAVGQRAIKYYMKQPPENEINDLTEKIIDGRQDKKMRQIIGEAFKKYLDNANLYSGEALPCIPFETRKDIAELSNMATKARSSVKRKKYSHDNPIERKNLREMPFRFAKQLANLAKAFMIMNNGPLTGLDHNILYKTALDSIPSERKEVMMAATKFQEITLDGLAMEMNLPSESAKMYLDDLVALEIMTKSKGFNNKFSYRLREDHKKLMAKFENIPMTNKVLDTGETEPLPQELTPQEMPLTPQEQAILNEVGI